MLRAEIRVAQRMVLAMAVVTAVVCPDAESGGGAAAREGAVRETPAAKARALAHDANERLRSEIRVLTELREAQSALRDWNADRRKSGEPLAALDPGLCAQMKDWCALLPATFGRSAPEGGRR